VANDAGEKFVVTGIDDDGWIGKSAEFKAPAFDSFKVLKLDLEMPGWAPIASNGLKASVDGARSSSVAVPRQTFESVYVPLPPGAQRLVHLDASTVFPIPGDGRQRSFAIKNISFENLTQTDLLARGWHKSGYLFGHLRGGHGRLGGPALSLHFPPTGRFNEAIVEVVRFPSKRGLPAHRHGQRGPATSRTLGLERTERIRIPLSVLRDTSVELSADRELPARGPGHALALLPRREHRLRLSFGQDPPAMLLSLVVPVYREEKNIPEFLRRIGPILGAITQDYEIIFAMDPSPDRTEEVILEERAGTADQAPQVLAPVRPADGEPGRDAVLLGRRRDRHGRRHAGPARARGPDGRQVAGGLRCRPSAADPPDGRALDQAPGGGDRLQGHQQDRRREDPAEHGRLPAHVAPGRERGREAAESHGFLRGMVAVVGFKQCLLPFERPARFSGETNYNRFFGSLRIGFNGIFCFSTYALTLSTQLGFLIAGASF
jgi:polyisoprenyl-phosphate glycosyltransferase